MIKAFCLNLAARGVMMDSLSVYFVLYCVYIGVCVCEREREREREREVIELVKVQFPVKTLACILYNVIHCFCPVFLLYRKP